MCELTTKERILGAARSSLLADGYVSLSTRNVAEGAGVPLSQIHYHFGSKEQLILAMLRAENDRLVDRQAAMFSGGESFAEQWELACDFLDDDLESGYVRVLQELIAAGWSSDVVGAEVRVMLKAWESVVTGAVLRAEQQGVNLGGFAPSELALLNASLFLGAESMILLGEDIGALKGALRKIGMLIARVERGAES